MRLPTFILCSMALMGCEPDRPQGKTDPARRTVGVTASRTGAPSIDLPATKAERPERAPLPKALRTSQPAASATASTSAAAAASAAPEVPEGLLGALSQTVSIKVTRMVTEGESQEGTIYDKGMVGPLLDAIGLQQTPKEGCQTCMPSLTFTFQDGYRTRLATLGALCTRAGVARDVATLSDPLGNECETIHLLKPEVLEELTERAIAEMARRPKR